MPLPARARRRLATLCVVCLALPTLPSGSTLADGDGRPPASPDQARIRPASGFPPDKIEREGTVLREEGPGRGDDDREDHLPWLPGWVIPHLDDTGLARVARAVRVPEGPVIDGRLEDPVWRDVPQEGPLIQVTPDTGDEPTEETLFKICYDDENLYIGILCLDSEPDAVLAREMALDGNLGADDYVEILIDTFLDRRNGYYFRVNPLGARNDALITNNSTFNESWDGIWTARGHRDDQGYSVEIAIPFRSISFNPQSSSWGFNLGRNIKRRFERNRWSGARPEFRLSTVSEAGTLTGLEGLDQGLGLELTPYVLGRLTHDDDASDTDLEGDFGGDVRYRITPNLQANLSYNTDFAETEVDSRRINLTRFPLFFPEKRDFFLEDSGIFDFANLDDDEFLPFFSRRIGLSSSGEPVPIILATRVTGRVDEYSIGVMDAILDDHDEFDEKNAFVARVSRNVLDQSSVGVLTTVGDPDSRQENATVGGDFNYRTSKFLGDQIFTSSAYLLSSFTEDEASEDNLAFGGHVALPNDLYEAGLTVYQVDSGYDAALGFVPRKGVRAYRGHLSLEPRPDVDWLRKYFFTYRTSYVTDLSNRVDTARHRVTPMYLLFESGEELYFYTEREYDAPEEDFTISEGVTIPAGRYWWDEMTVGWETASKRWFEVEGSFTFGEFYTGHRKSFDFDLDLKPVHHVRLRLGYGLNRIELDEGDFQTRLGRIRLQLNFTPDIIWFNLLQYDNVSDSVGFNSRIFWEFRPGARTYLVLNQGYARDDGNLDLGTSEVSVKVSMSFRF